MFKSRNSHTAGFTLLELMLVLVLMGLAATFVIVGNRADKSDLARATEGLNQLFEHAAEQAIQQEAVYGVYITKTGAQLMQQQGKDIWSKTRTRLISFPSTVEIRLQADKSVMLLRDKPLKEDSPQLLFLPGGEVTNFTLSLSLDGCLQRITNSGFMLTAHTEVICDES